MSSDFRPLLSLALGLVACNPEADLPGGSQGNLGTGTPLPCEVQRVLDANCADCHGSHPHGAPMPINSLEDARAMIGDTRSPPVDNVQKPVYQRMYERINATSNAMPQGAQLAPQDLAILNNWLLQNAPAGPACAVNPGGAGGAPPQGSGGYVVASGGTPVVGAGGAVVGAGGTIVGAGGAIVGAGGAVVGGAGGAIVDDGSCTNIDIRARCGRDERRRFRCPRARAELYSASRITSQ